MSQLSMTVQFTGGSLTLGVDADIFALSRPDLDFILGLRDQLLALGEPTSNGLPPATEAEKETPGGGSAEVAAPKVKAVKPVKPKSIPRPPSRLTPEEKAEVVREADETGNDSEVQRKHGLGAGTVAYWRKVGHGKRAKAKPSTANYNEPPKVADPSGPAVRCPVCHVGCPVVDPSDNAEKRRVLGVHFVDSPDCKETMRRRG